MQLPKQKKSYEIRVVATNGKAIWDLYWVKVRSNEVQSGLSASSYQYHSSFHQTGEIRISKEQAGLPSRDDAPAAAQVGETFGKRTPLDKLTGKVRVAAFALLIDDNSLEDYPTFRKKTQHDSVVYIDTRCFPKNCVSIEAWVSPRGHFFQRMPNPPGFRTTFDLAHCCVAIDIGHQ